MKTPKNVVKPGDLVRVFRWNESETCQKYHGDGLVVGVNLAVDMHSYGGRTNIYTVLIDDCVQEMNTRNWAIERIDNEE